MTRYYLKLALRSFRRAPGTTAVIVGTIGVGIAVCMVTLTVYEAMAGNPIWWKNDRLYAVTMDSWDPTEPYDSRHPALAPPLLTYKDAKYLSESGIPAHRALIFRMQGVMTGGPAQSKPIPVDTRITTGDFFPMFDIPFLYGSGWNTSADRRAEAVIVLTRRQNEVLFGGANSVGRTIRWNDRLFRVTGVLDDWSPRPRFYDVVNDPFGVPEDAYIPFGWGEVLEQYPQGRMNCWGAERVDSFRGLLGSECVWIHMWVDLPDRVSRERMQAFMDAYWSRQHQAGRFARARNNNLTTVGQWLQQRDVVNDDNRMLLGFAFVFLAVCVTNAAGILLARFLNTAPVTGIRRAVGASRLQIFIQHLVEAGLLCAWSALLGLGLGAAGLGALRILYETERTDGGGYQSLMHFDTLSVVSAVVLALLATLAAGVYPAWRVGRLPPASYLKSGS